MKQQAAEPYDRLKTSCVNYVGPYCGFEITCQLAYIVLFPPVVGDTL